MALTMSRARRAAPRTLALLLCGAAAPVPALAGPIDTGFNFTAGDLVISTVACQTCPPGTSSASALDQASPITLDEFSLGMSGGTFIATSAGTLELPQTSSGANDAISGEYGSASEGILEQSVDGHDLTIMGYGVNAAQFNASPSTYGSTGALGQSTSATTPRVVALIGNNGTVDTSTALTNVYNQNNPRSVVTVDGSAFYISGQGSGKSDPNQGVFYATKGATIATNIFTPTDGSGNSYDTRAVEIYNGQLYVSEDINPSGSGGQNFTNVGMLSNGSITLPTSSAGVTDTHIIPPASPDSLGGNNGSITLSKPLDNNVNSGRNGSFVYLSPEQYFFANPDTLYVTDSGEPKNGNANKAALGEGGLQKWSLINGTWTLDYDLYMGLDLVNNAGANSATPTAAGVTGLFGLTGEVVGGEVELFATSYGLNELSPSFLYEITDDLTATDPTTATTESFTTLYSAPLGTSIRGVAFAPVPEPSSLALLGAGLIVLGLRRRRARA